MNAIEATVCYVIKDGKALLIRKKRGVGAGKWNGPGGKVEVGETPLECAVRETKEEIGITPRQVKFAGHNEFFMDGKPFFNVHVFVAEDFSGELKETDEAKPEWFDIDKIPYDNMWADDEHWMPLMFQGKPFKGKFYFVEKDKLQNFELVPEE